jgi:hypothetical protein
MAISVKFESIAKKVYRRLLSIPVVGTTAKVLVARRRGQPQAWYRDPRTGTLLQAIVGLQAEVSELKRRLEAVEARQHVRS